MIAAALPVSTLLIGTGLLLTGSGMVGTLLGLRGVHEGLSDGTLGVVTSSFFIGYIVGVFACPILLRKVGHIRTFAALAAIASCVALLFGLAISPWVWSILRLLNGIAVVGIYMVIESWLNERAVEGRAQVFAAYMMVCLFAQGIGQYVVLIYGPLDLASFALVAIFFAAGLIPVALTPVSQPAPVHAPSLSFSRLFRIAPVGAVGAFVSGMVTGSFWGLAASFALQSGLRTEGVVHFLAAAIFSGVLVQWPIGRLSDRKDRRVVLIWVSLLSAAGAVVLMLPKIGLSGVVIASSVFGAFGFSIYGLSVAQTHDRFQSSSVLEATKGLLLLHGAGAIVGPLITGGLMHKFGADAFAPTMAGMLLVLAMFAWRRILIDEPVPPEERTEFVMVNRTSAVAMDMDPRISP